MTTEEINYAKQRLEDFLANLPPSYREANLVFASYAAFLEVFSPDMLYQLWLFFQDYKKGETLCTLPMVVVADLLQSGLCEEIAFELYEMDELLAQYLRKNSHTLSQESGLTLLYTEKDLAMLTLEYAERYYKYSNRQNLYDMYYWKSLFVIDPATASQEIKDTLKNLKESKEQITKNARIFLQLAKMQAERSIDTQDIDKLPTFSLTKKGDSINIKDKYLIEQISKLLSIRLKSNNFKVQFWFQFLTKAREKTDLFTNVNPMPEAILKDSRIDIGAGINKVNYELRVQDIYASICLYINLIQQESNSFFDELFKYKEEIENAFGQPLIWLKNEGKRHSRIELKLEDINLYDKEQWGKINSFLITNIILLKSTLNPHLERIKSIGIRNLTNQEDSRIRLIPITDDISIEMIFIKGGVFEVGYKKDRDGKAIHNQSFIPKYEITLNDFYIGKYQVTQEQYQAIMRINPSYFIGEELPVERVSWNDAQAFIKKLNKKTGRRFRLPSETEWEYSARGGQESGGFIYSGSNYIEDVAWYINNSQNKPHEVGTKDPNELGLYDMTGNVWEWCSDWHTSDVNHLQVAPEEIFKVVRGGCWGFTNILDLRLVNRSYRQPSFGFFNTGFRLVMDL